MYFREARKTDSADICGLSIDELGWTSSKLHLEEVLDNYPGAVAINAHGVCGFAYSNPLSSDILRISNLLVAREYRHKGVGEHLLKMVEDEAKDAGYEAILFPEDPNWFEEKSLEWIEEQGYRSIYNTDQSAIVIKETL